ncbi:exopolyphosphatase PRUNE1 isoform X1 [Jatropha curcas]|uniref:exopolyphosphatase PRUNE1 isoform X1 n=1 Tax=Jatropha curcas TaxID=180498 RepID=UPI0005FBFA8D|nr:exopolyphosphatase PRUNE1 isoform X1 [Jatropha curcas]
MGSPKRNPLQEPYIRARENPYFNGLIRGGLIKGDNASRDQTSSTLNFQGIDESQNFSGTTSDISDERSKNSSQDISEEFMESQEEDLSSVNNMNPIGQSAFSKLSKIAKVTPVSFPNFQSELTIEVFDTCDSVKKPSPKNSEATEEYHIVSNLARPVIEKSYSINQRKQNLSKIPLPQSAASFYNGFSPQIEIVESCESISRLNLYLKSRRGDVSVGVPGRFLHAVIGQDVSDIGSVAATIMYAFYLNETLESDQLCTVPVINMKRADFSSHAELTWLLDSCQIDESSIIFIDEIDLSYYDLFGSLKLVLLNGHKLPTKQEALKEAVVEIFNCREGESVYPGVENVTVGQDDSCCTLIAEKLALTSPEILVGQGFSRILLAGILLDTGNLTGSHCTTKDKYMATLLINGAGRFGLNGLYQLLRYKMYDVSDLRVADILRKDFKKWTRVGKLDTASSRSLISNIGMSSIGISIEQFLAHEGISTEEIKNFQQLEKLRLLMIVSGYYDSQKNFKREILVVAESVELMKNLLLFLNSNASHLPLKVLHNPGLKEEMKIFEIDRITSRKTIERLLEDFGGALKA